MSVKTFLRGAGYGIVAGTIIGLLLAPAKGSETRKKISDKADWLKDRWQHLKGLSPNELDELKEVFKHEVTGLRDDVRQRVLRLIEASKATGNSVKETMSS